MLLLLHDRNSSRGLSQAGFACSAGVSVSIVGAVIRTGIYLFFNPAQL